MEQNLSGKKILITGGTSRLGSAFVKKALAKGAAIFLTYYKNKEEASNLERLGARGFELDLADAAAIKKFSAVLKDEIKTLDVLIHNAALVRDATLQNLTEADWDAVMAVDLKAPYLLTKNLLPLFLRKTPPGGKIFMITSRLAIHGGIGVTAYASAKAGLIALSQSLAAELGKRNILVNAINPGFMISAMTEHLPEQVLTANRALSCLNRMSDPEEVADFLSYLCSDAMTQVTGQIFHLESRKIGAYFSAPPA